MKLLLPVRNAAISAVFVIAGASASAETTLLGDTISFLRAYPNTSTQYSSSIPDTTVSAGTSDRVSWIVSGQTYTTFDPEALSIGITTAYSGYGSPGSAFDGYVISGFDHDIQSIAVTNGTSYTVMTTLLDPRTIAIDLKGLSSGTFSIGLTFAQPIPEPASVGLMLAGLGLVTVAVRRRRSQHLTH